MDDKYDFTSPVVFFLQNSQGIYQRILYVFARDADIVFFF